MSSFPIELKEVLSREVKGSREQGSEEWLQARMGCLTGSQIEKVVPMRPYRGSWSAPATATKYIDEKIMEATSGVREEVNDSQGYMAWGTEHEGDARAIAEDIINLRIYEVGAIEMPWSPRVRISPDGVGVDGDGKIFTFETKSPKTLTHTGYLRAGKVPSKYKVQVQAEMMACKAEYSYFMSYDPRAIGYEAMLIKVEKDEELQARIEEWCKKALKKLDKGIEDVKKNAISINTF